MSYIDTQTSEYPLSRADIEAALPNAIWPNDRPPPPYALVLAALELPTPGQGVERVQGAPELIDGVWRQTWTLQAVVRSLAELQAQVNADRDARIDGGFFHEVGGVTYRFQSAPSDRENVMGMSMAAQGAIAAMQAADPPVNPVGNLRWFDPATDFKWITADNTLAPMDALQVIDLFKAGATFKATVTFMARAYKDAMIDAGTDAGAQAIYNAIVWPE